MRKFKLLFISMSLILLLGCGDKREESNSKKHDKNQSSKTEVSVEPEEDTDLEEINPYESDYLKAEFIEEIDVTEYGFPITEDNGVYYVVIENKSDEGKGILGTAVAKDYKGKEEVSEIYIEYLGPGEKTVQSFYFISENIEEVDIRYRCIEEDFNTPVIKNISVKQFSYKNNLIAELTNNNEITVRDGSVTALFFDENNNFIACDSDCSYIFEAGETWAVQLSAYADFDHAEVYVYGLSSYDEIDDSNIDSSLIETEEYYCISEEYGLRYFVAMKNNSDKFIQVDATVVVKDMEGNSIGVEEICDLYIGPGETTIDWCFFGDVDEFDKVVYELKCTENEFLDPVICNLVEEHGKTKDGLEINITNNGDVPAEYVKAVILFLDDNESVVDYRLCSVNDDAVQIKPGNTERTLTDEPEEYDSVKIYLKGWHFKE